MKKIDFKELDVVSKVVLIVLIVLIVYFGVFSVSSVFFVSEQNSMMGMMNEMMGSSMSFSTNNSIITNLISLILALLIGFLVSLSLFKNKEGKDEEYNILRKALSVDERKVLDEIRKSREITQDSLRFRLEWSKAKVSTILTNLDKIGLIQRERVGKTYNVCMQK